MLVWFVLVLKSVCRFNVLEFVLTQPFQSCEPANGSEEVLNGTDGLDHQNLFRDNPERVILKRQAAIVQRFLEPLELGSEPLRLLCGNWYSDFTRATISPCTVCENGLRKDEKWKLGIGHCYEVAPLVLSPGRLSV